MPIPVFETKIKESGRICQNISLVGGGGDKESEVEQRMCVHLTFIDIEVGAHTRTD